MAVEGTGIQCRALSAAQAAAIAGESGNWDMRLVSAGPETPGRDDLVADYTTAAFTGYGDATSVTINQARDENNDDVDLIGAATFQAADPILAPDTVIGVMLLDPAPTPDAPVIIIYFDSPIIVANPNQYVVVTIKFNCSTSVATCEVTS